MRTSLAVAADLIREAMKRKWFLGLAIAITALLVTLGLSLRMEVVDGALAATRLFGKLSRSPSSRWTWRSARCSRRGPG